MLLMLMLLLLRLSIIPANACSHGNGRDIVCVNKQRPSTSRCGISIDIIPMHQIVFITKLFIVGTAIGHSNRRANRHGMQWSLLLDIESLTLLDSAIDQSL
jgi:hypothetical protein